MKTLNRDQLLKIGTFGKGRKFHLREEFETETSRAIRSPSHRWPLSIWNHCKTAKYYNSLNDHQRHLLGIEVG